MRKIFSVDRFEGDYAVCENESGKMELILRSDLPDGIKEGDVFIYNGKTYQIDSEETKKRKKRIEALQEQLFKE